MDDVRAAGGEYVEAPVSGSRAPAEVVRCGDAPEALLMKLAAALEARTAGHPALTGL